MVSNNISASHKMSKIWIFFQWITDYKNCECHWNNLLCALQAVIVICCCHVYGCTSLMNVLVRWCLWLCGRHPGATQADPLSLLQSREAAAGEDEEAGATPHGPESEDHAAWHGQVGVLGARKPAGGHRQVGSGGAGGHAEAAGPHPERADEPCGPGAGG